MNVTKLIEYFGIAVAVAFIGMGLFLVTTNAFSNLPSNYKIVFSSLLIAYGGFRLISIILNIKSKKQDENEEA